MDIKLFNTSNIASPVVCEGRGIQNRKSSIMPSRKQIRVITNICALIYLQSIKYARFNIQNRLLFNISSILFFTVLLDNDIMSNSFEAFSPNLAETIIFAHGSINSSAMV